MFDLAPRDADAMILMETEDKEGIGPEPPTYQHTLAYQLLCKAQPAQGRGYGCTNNICSTGHWRVSAIP